MRVIVGPRTVVAHVDADGRSLRSSGRYEVAGRETVGGYDVTIVDVGNPHAVVVGDPNELETIGPLLETHARFPERHERPGRARRRGPVE